DPIRIPRTRKAESSRYGGRRRSAVQKNNRGLPPLNQGVTMLPNEVPVLNKIAQRAYQLLRQIDPNNGPEACPGPFFRQLYDLIWDCDRSLNQPSPNDIESCVKQAIREYYVAPPPSPDQKLAAVVAAEAEAKAAAATEGVN